jgi:molecular chaperone GrpE
MDEQERPDLESDTSEAGGQDPLEDSEDPAAGAVPIDRAVLESAASRLGELAEARDRLAAEKAELRDLLQRRQAEFENFRRRVNREKTELLEYAAMDSVREILPILDDFERALAVETADENYAAGMRLIQQRMLDTLRKLGLEPVEAAGKTFDPNIHEAIDMTYTKDHKDHEVLAEYQKGYNFKGRLLRPARVKVAVHPAKSE